MDGELKDLSFPRKDLPGIPLVPEVTAPRPIPVCIDERVGRIPSGLRAKIEAALLRALVDGKPL